MLKKRGEHTTTQTRGAGGRARLMAGISLAPDDDWNVAAPTWERIDDDYNVQSWTIDRGRPNEMCRTDTGTATIELVDRTGDFDPTNTGGAFYGGYLGAEPVQAKIELQNPVTDAWSTLFRGFIASIHWVPYRSPRTTPTSPSSSSTGSPSWPPARWRRTATSATASIPTATSSSTKTPTLDAVKTRIGKVLDEAGWPGTLRSIFTGNVGAAEEPCTRPARPSCR